jgi:hypothetical protein
MEARILWNSDTFSGVKKNRIHSQKNESAGKSAHPDALDRFG